MVGAGPAGASAARVLAAAGIDVVLLEREVLPRYKVCGGGLVYRARRLLHADVDDVIERPCHAATLSLAPAGHSITARRSQPVVSMTMRAELDQALVAVAARAGARIVQGCEVQGLVTARDSVVLETAQGRLQAGFVVAADGASGRIARWAGWRDGRVMAPALEWEVSVPETVRARFDGAARFDLGAIERGYGWVFPKRSHLSVGIGVLLPRGRGPALKQALLRYLDEVGVGPILSARRHGYVIPVTPRGNTLAQGRVLLTGDAAGLADPLTAEGISSALLSGRLAGEALVAAAPDPARVAAAYQSRLAAQILPELHAARPLARLLYTMPRIAGPLFRRYGDRVTERVTDVFMGQRSYADLARRLPFVIK